jgi:hypothetical protein
MKPTNVVHRWLTASTLAFLCASAGAAEHTYQYFRFTPDKLRTEGANSIQLSEFQFLLGGTPLSTAGVVVSNPLGNNPNGEQPPNIIDGSTATKWLDFNKSYIQFQFPTEVTIDGYNFATANDATERDPVSWTLTGSTNGTDWEPLDVRSNYPTTTARFTYQTPFTLPAKVPALITNFSVGPTVVLDNSTVDVEWATSFATAVTLDTGSGPAPVSASGIDSFIPEPGGDTTVVLAATNGVEPVTASRIIRSVAGGSESFRYVRFTPVSLRDNATATSIQLSEFFFVHGFGIVPVESATNPGGNSIATEEVGNLIDNSVATKWLDFNKGPVIFDFGSIQEFDHYGFATANDYVDRDPVRWILEGRNSEDEEWELIDNMTAFDFLPPLDRQVYTQDIPLPGSTLDIYPPLVILNGDSSAILPGQPFTIHYRAVGGTSLSADQGIGELPLSGSITVQPETTTSYTFTATNSFGDAFESTISVQVLPQPAITTITYPHFDQSGSELARLGAAVIINDPTRPLPGNFSRLRLTPDVGSQNGTAWFRYRQDVADGFETTFDIHLTTTGTTSGADGMAFVIQNHPLGTNAQPANTHENGLPLNALNICFDSYLNTGEPSAAVVRILAGTQVVQTVNLAGDARFVFPGTNPLDMTDNSAVAAPYRVRVVYKPGDLDVYFSVNPEEEHQIVDSADVDLGEIGAMDSAGTSLVGFTARTGGEFEAHDVTRWFWGTVPETPESNLMLVSHSFDFAADQLTLTWNSTPGKTYRVTTSTDFSGWTPVQSGIASGGETTSVNVDFTQGPLGFFRVEEE